MFEKETPYICLNFLFLFWRFSFRNSWFGYSNFKWITPIKNI